MSKSSTKYIAKTSYDDLLKATTRYNARPRWGKIAHCVAHFIVSIFITKRYVVHHHTHEGTTTYRYALENLTPEIVWELLLRDMRLYKKREEIVLTKYIKRKIEWFLDVASYELPETRQRIAGFISSSIRNSAKLAGLPEYDKSCEYATTFRPVTITTPDTEKYTAVCKFITENFPASAPLFNAVIAPDFTLTSVTRPSLNDIRQMSRDFHPDKLIGKSEVICNVAAIGIIIVNQLRDEHKLSFTFEDIYNVL